MQACSHIVADSKFCLSSGRLRASTIVRIDDAELGSCYKLLIAVKDHYPGFEAWFNGKVRPGCIDGSRAVFASVSMAHGGIQGVVIAKRALCEAKICTLFVLPECSGAGIGTGLLRHALRWLRQPLPVITVDDQKLGCFQSIFAAHNFKKTSSIVGLYRPGRVEHVFNDFNAIHLTRTHAKFR